MKELIRHILKEQNEGLKERFIKSANKMVYIIETHVESNLITNIEIENIMFDEKYSEISGDLIITSWCEDPDILEFIRTLKMVDKEIEKVLTLMPQTAKYYFTQASIPRAMPADVLADKANSFGLTGKIFEDVQKALEDALLHAHKDDLILVCGSVFLVGEVNVASMKKN